MNVYSTVLDILKTEYTTENVFLMKVVVNSLKIKVCIVIFLKIESKMVIFGIYHKLEWEFSL